LQIGVNPFFSFLRQFKSQEAAILPSLKRSLIGFVENSKLGNRGILNFFVKAILDKAFTKKSKSSIKTPQEDVNLIAERLKRVQTDYEGRQTT
jgi:hypothetical protein